MISECYVSLIKEPEGSCVGIVKKLKGETQNSRLLTSSGSKWVPKYVELHSLLLALYKNKEESVQVSFVVSVKCAWVGKTHDLHRGTSLQK